jgi:RNA polymerase sigma-70 factor (ECF subfamily)
LNVNAPGRLTSRACFGGPEDSQLVALVRQISAGHPQSLERLYVLTVKQLSSIALSVLSSRMDAEEVVCDTFVYAWQHSHGYDGARGPVMAWLSVITRHRALDLLRKRRCHYSLERDHDRPRAAGHPCHAKGPEQVLAQAQAGENVRCALADLPHVRRRLVELAFFEQLTHQEISVLMSMPAGTVKSHIRRALRKLATAIDQNL